MPSNIEQRVVQMKFDNAQFESATQTSIGTLGKLKRALDFKGADSGLKNIAASTKGFTLNGIADGVDKLTARFSNLGIVGVTAISNISNKAVDAGMRLAQSLSTDQIGSGFGEYETKIGSIQTMLANTQKYGTQLPEVKKVLEDLNTYSDKTIYNFGDMTKNIGLFTNAGLKIGESADMIQGFSNVAAASGTTSQGAASAAYQLSQALSAGTIRLMDWRSLTTVGMGNANMKQGIIDIAQAMGKFKDDSGLAELASKDFNGSLEKGWLTADVMSNYLRIMTGDQSKFSDAQMKALGLSDQQIASFNKQAETAKNAATMVRTFTQFLDTMKESIGSSWAQTFELLIGDFDQATQLWTKASETLGPMILASGEARNASLKTFIDAGGMKAILTTVGNAWDSLNKIVNTVKDSFAKVFPPTTNNTIQNIAKAIQDFSNKVKISDGALKGISVASLAFFTAIKFGIVILQGLGVIVIGVFDYIANAVNLAFGKIPGAVKIVEDSINGFLNGFTGGSGIKFVEFDKLGDSLLGIVDAIAKFDLGSFRPILGFFEDLLSKIDTLAASGGEKLARFFSFNNLKAAGAGLKQVWDSVIGIITSGGDLIGRTGDTFQKWFGKIGQDILKGAAGIKTFFVQAVVGIKNDIVGFNNGISGAINSISGNTVASAILSAFDLGMIIVIMKKLKSIFGKASTITSAFENFSKAFEGLIGVFEGMQKTLKAAMLVQIAAAIMVLAIALTLLSRIDPNKLTSAAIGLGVSIAALSAGMILIDEAKINSAGLLKTTASMILMAVAIVALAKAVQMFVDMKMETLAQGLIAVAISVYMLSAMITVVSELEGSIVKASIGLIIMAGAIAVLGAAVAIFGLMPIDVLLQGGIALGLIMGALILFMQMVPTESVLAAGIGMVALSIAIGSLVGSVVALGLVPFPILIQGMISLAAVLLGLVLAMEAMDGVQTGAAGMLAAAFAIGILVPPLILLGMLPVDNIVQGLLALAGVMIILAEGVNAMQGTLAGAAAMVVVSIALSILAGAILILGQASPETIVVGLLALAGALLIFGAAAALIAPVLPAMLGMSGAIALFGLAVLAVGAGVAIFAIGLMLLGPAAAVGAAGIVLLGTAIAQLGTQALQLMAVGVGFAVVGVGLLILAAATVTLGVGLSAMGAGLMLIGLFAPIGIVGLLALTQAVQGMLIQIPGLIAFGGAMGVLGAGLLVAGAGALLMGAGAIVLGLGLLILVGVSNLVVSVVTLLVDSFTRLSNSAPQMEAFSISANNLQTALANLATSMTSTNTSLTEASSALSMVTLSAQTMVAAIGSLPPAVTTAMTSIVTTFTTSSGQINAQVLSIGVTLALMKILFDNSARDVGAAVTGLANQIQGGSARVVSEVASMGVRVVQTLDSVRSGAESSASRIGTAIVDGIVKGLSDSGRVESAARSVAQAALSAANAQLGIKSPSREFFKTGKFSVAGIEKGFLDNEGGLVNSVVGMADRLVTVVRASLGNAGSGINDLIDSNPVITPVIDLSTVRQDAKTLNGMMDSSFNVAAARLGAINASREIGAPSGNIPNTPMRSDTNINYTQNNYSPKALSRTEIYRNTKNQLSSLKG